MSRNITQATRDFRELCELTKRICGYMPQSLPTRYGKEKWLRLLKIWDKYPSALRSWDVLSDALRFSVNPAAFQNHTSDQKKLFEKVASFFYSKSQAYQSWEKSNRLNDLFNYPPKTNLPFSSEYNRYLSANYKILVKCHMKLVNSPYSLTITEEDYAAVDNFNKILDILLPSSKSWTLPQWLDQKFLLTELKRLYGINFLKKCNREVNGPNFNSLIMIAIDTIYGSDSVHGIYLTDAINLPIARALWGTNAETVLLEHYRYSIEIVKDNAPHTPTEETFLYYAEDIFKSSWMNTHVKEWVQDSASPYHYMAKRIIFELRLCLPEYLPDKFNF